ncbi:MAG: hypothetical protein K8T10_21905 [Candidatus Eremiobacteraeota bacterium]|nr:hypothetical protein [Candidatus Eremiobacteraeota bacterium]
MSSGNSEWEDIKEEFITGIGGNILLGLFILAIWLICKLVAWLYGGVAQWWDWLSGHF